MSYKKYDYWCKQQHALGHSVPWVTKEEFTKRIESDEDFRKEWSEVAIVDKYYNTYSTWCKQQHDLGYYVDWLQKEEFTKRMESDEDSEFQKEWSINKIMDKEYIKKKIQQYKTKEPGFFREFEEEAMLKSFFPTISIHEYYTAKIQFIYYEPNELKHYHTTPINTITQTVWYIKEKIRHILSQND